MKNTILKTIETTLVILMLTVFAQTSVSAQETSNEESNIQIRANAPNGKNANGLEGVWNVQITRRNCQTGMILGTGSAMLTYNQGGTMHEYGAGLPPATRGSGHGIWNADSNGQFTSAFQFFIFHSDGTLGGRMIVRQQIQLSGDENSWTETTTTQTLDVNGNVIRNGCVTGTATRFQ